MLDGSFRLPRNTPSNSLSVARKEEIGWGVGWKTANDMATPQNDVYQEFTKTNNIIDLVDSVCYVPNNSLVILLSSLGTNPSALNGHMPCKNIIKSQSSTSIRSMRYAYFIQRCRLQTTTRNDQLFTWNFNIIIKIAMSPFIFFFFWSTLLLYPIRLFINTLLCRSFANRTHEYYLPDQNPNILIPHIIMHSICCVIGQIKINACCCCF